MISMMTANSKENKVPYKPKYMACCNHRTKNSFVCSNKKKEINMGPIMTISAMPNLATAIISSARIVTTVYKIAMMMETTVKRIDSQKPGDRLLTRVAVSKPEL